MATAKTSDSKHRVRQIRAGNDQFDDLTLIWLDAQINSSSDCLHAKERLRLIVNVLKTFDNVNNCLECIRSMDDDEYICLIVSGSLSNDIIPIVVDLSQIACVTIYCFDELHIPDGTYRSDKFLGVFVEFDPLLDALNKRIIVLRRSLSSISSFALNKLENERQKSVKDLSQENATFIWFQLLIQALFRLPRTEKAREKMIEECQRQYHDNPVQLIKIKEFAEKYQPSDVISWYTRDTFVYRVINRALRTQNIDIILTFYPLIADLHDQLTVLHEIFLDVGPAPLLTVYRGQRIQSSELSKITRTVGHLVSMNSFFSTGFDRTLARQFAGDNQMNDGLVSILYEVHIDTEVAAAPFSNISEHSQYPGEEEFLFSLGAVFRIESAREITDSLGRVWLITIRLVDEHQEQELNSFFEHWKSEIGETSNLLELAALLFHMDNLSAAERYYKLLRDELPKDHPDQPLILNNLGQIALKVHKTEEALQLFDQALQGYAADSNPRKDLIAVTKGNIATIHYELNDFERAEPLCREALQLKETYQIADHKILINAQSNLAAILRSQGKFHEALEQLQQALASCHRLFKTENHPTCGVIHGNIGTIYTTLGRINEAIASLERSLAIQKRCLPPKHYSFVTCHANLGHAYIHVDNYVAALNHFENALIIEKEAGQTSQTDSISLSNIYHGFSLVYLRQNKFAQAISYCERAMNILPIDHPSRAMIYRQQGAILREMGAAQAAKELYQKAIALLGNADIERAECMYGLGLIQYDLNEKDQAISLLEQALEIRQRVLPPSHPDIAKLYSEIGAVLISTNRFQEALNNFEQTRILQSEIFPKNHIETARTMNNIGIALYKLNRFEDSLTYINQAVQIAQEILPPTDLFRRMVENTITTVQTRVQTSSNSSN